MAIRRSQQDEERGSVYRANVPLNIPPDGKVEYLKTDINRILTRLSGDFIDLKKRVEALEKKKG